MSLLSALTPGITSPAFKTGAGPGQFTPPANMAGPNDPEGTVYGPAPAGRGVVPGVGVGQNAEIAQAMRAFPGLSPQAALAQWRSGGQGNPQLNPGAAATPGISDLLSQPMRARQRLLDALSPR